MGGEKADRPSTWIHLVFIDNPGLNERLVG